MMWNLLLIPSVYGALVWVGLLSLMTFDLVPLNITSEATSVFLYVVLCFLVSSAAFFRDYAAVNILKFGVSIKSDGLDRFFFWVFTVIGFFGLYLYILDFSSNFGGLAGFFEVFFSNPLEIRALATEVVSLGFQVSYFSWISVFYCVAYLVLGDARLRPNIFLLILVGGIGFFLNLLFIDRTRPTILFLVCLLSVGIIRFSRMKNPMRFYVSVFAGPLLIFFVQALYTGKYDSEGGLFGNFLAYVLGGFGYFSSLLGDVTPDYSLVRIFYPLSKLMESAGLLDSVPAQILDFREVPFFTNVGTFLEPLLSDGGIWLVIVGVPLLVFSIDLMALRALRDRSIMGLFIWANMVLVALFSFFVPKYNATQIYLFVSIYFAGQFIRSMRFGRGGG